MNSSNVSTKQIREAVTFLTTEIRAMPLPTALETRVQHDFLLEFASGQRRSGYRGYSLLIRARFAANGFRALQTGNTTLSAFEQVWLTYLLSRALLIACGCYGADAWERTLHWQYYKPLLALLRGCDHPNRIAPDDKRATSFMRPALTFSLN